MPRGCSDWVAGCEPHPSFRIRNSIPLKKEVSVVWFLAGAGDGVDERSGAAPATPGDASIARTLGICGTGSIERPHVLTQSYHRTKRRIAIQNRRGIAPNAGSRLHKEPSVFRHWKRFDSDA